MLCVLKLVWMIAKTIGFGNKRVVDAGRELLLCLRPQICPTATSVFSNNAALYIALLRSGSKSNADSGRRCQQWPVQLEFWRP